MNADFYECWFTIITSISGTKKWNIPSTLSVIQQTTENGLRGDDDATPSNK